MIKMSSGGSLISQFDIQVQKTLTSGAQQPTKGPARGLRSPSENQGAEQRSSFQLLEYAILSSPLLSSSSPLRDQKSGPPPFALLY